MKMMTALALVLASAPAAYAAGPNLNESFIEQVGTHNNATISQKHGNNNQATSQTGQYNSVLSNQNGAAAGAGPNNSANVQVGNDNTAVISQKNGSNNQSTFQAGRANAVTTSQVSKLATGSNNSGNVQAGDFNTATTTQTNSPPNSQATGVNYANDSMSAQYGTGNTVIAKQTGGQNNQGTVQAGDDNLSQVKQSDKAIIPATGAVVGGANTSFTGQFGDNNIVTTSQKTADANSEFSAGNGYGNAPRNIARGPGLWQTDLALSKQIPIREFMQLEFRSEVFNLFNRAQYGLPLADFSTSTFGQIINTVNTGPVGTGTPREIQP